MKKIIATIIMLFIVASALCVTALAEDVPAGTVLRISGGKIDDEPTVIKDCQNLVDGWNEAINYALNKEMMAAEGYDRIIVDLYTDWTAVKGEFSNSGVGFDYDAIEFPSGVKVTLNMNGHTINRALWTWQYNGEVIVIGSGADVIINNGTIKGGWSCTGGGGIHIHNKAKVTLNNVNVIGNISEDDDGGGIAIYGNATLTMNGGSLSDNKAVCAWGTSVYGGGIYADDCTVNLNGVTIQNNHIDDNGYGAAIYGKDSVINLDECKVLDNGLKISDDFETHSVIEGRNGSVITIKNTDLKGNSLQQTFRDTQTTHYPTLIYIYNSTLFLDTCNFTENNAFILLNLQYESELNADNCTFMDNKSTVFLGYCDVDEVNIVSNCKFNNNTGSSNYPYSFHLSNTNDNPTFVDCDFGDSTFNDKSYVTIIKNSRGKALVTSVFGEGSVITVIALGSLMVSIAAIGVCVSYKKKKSEQ